MFFLSAAAKNAADVESLALQAGLKKGGAAKGELVLAIFELANCFRHGWGIEKDPLAAKQVGSDLLGQVREDRFLTLIDKTYLLHSTTRQLQTWETPVRQAPL